MGLYNLRIFWTFGDCLEKLIINFENYWNITAFNLWSCAQKDIPRICCRWLWCKYWSFLFLFLCYFILYLRKFQAFKYWIFYDRYHSKAKLNWIFSIKNPIIILIMMPWIIIKCKHYGPNSFHFRVKQAKMNHDGILLNHIIINVQVEWSGLLVFQPLVMLCSECWLNSQIICSAITNASARQQQMADTPVPPTYETELNGVLGFQVCPVLNLTIGDL